jgi:hypothetical protein
LKHAESIGENIGTGLSRVRYRLENNFDKSKPNDDMPDWWISARWVPSESDEEDDEGKGEGEGEGECEGELNIMDDNNNNDDRHNDNNEPPPPPSTLIESNA